MVVCIVASKSVPGDIISYVAEYEFYVEIYRNPRAYNTKIWLNEVGGCPANGTKAYVVGSAAYTPEPSPAVITCGLHAEIWPTAVRRLEVPSRSSIIGGLHDGLVRSILACCTERRRCRSGSKTKRVKHDDPLKLNAMEDGPGGGRRDEYFHCWIFVGMR